MHKIKYSVIVPHFNDAARLHRLLQSIPSSRDDIEILVVDDCSTKMSELTRIQDKWTSVRWMSTMLNSGAGAARNLGLSFASGEYIIFSDSDDLFAPSAFEIFDEYVSNQELIYFLADGVQEIDGSRSGRADKFNHLVKRFSDSNSYPDLIELKLGHVVPWAKVYSRSFLIRTGIKFDEVRVADDIAFNVMAALQANRISAVSKVVYITFRRTGSITSNYNLSTILAEVDVLSNLNLSITLKGLPWRMGAGGCFARSLSLGAKDAFILIHHMYKRNLILPTIFRFSLRGFFGFLLRLRRESVELRRNAFLK